MRSYPCQKLILVCGLLCLLLWACEEADPCETVHCVHGTCSDESCDCDDRYEGLHCDTLASEKFLSNFWHNSLMCQSSTDYMQSVVTSTAGDLGGITIHNIYALGDSAFAYVHGDTVIVDEQTFGMDYIMGRGLYGTNAFTLEFTVRNTAGDVTQCVAHFQK